MEQVYTSHVKKGLLIAGLLVIINIISQFTAATYLNQFRALSIALFVISLVVSALIFSRELDKQLNFGMAFTHGFKTSTVITSILFIYTAISVYWAFPQQVERMVQEGVAAAKQQGKSELELSQDISTAHKVIPIFLLAGGLMLNLLTGALGALLGALVAPKKPGFQPSKP